MLKLIPLMAAPKLMGDAPVRLPYAGRRSEAALELDILRADRDGLAGAEIGCGGWDWGTGIVGNSRVDTVKRV